MLASLITGPMRPSASAAASEPLAERVVDRVEDDDAARRSAALPRVRERRGDGPFDGAVEIGVVTDDERVLAAELQTRLREAAAGRLGDRAAGRGGAGEADEVDARMLDERQARLASEPLDDVEHARRQARLEAEPREPPRRDRRVLGRLQHGAVTAEDGRERLPGDVRKRRVERDQQRGDADGAPQREHRAVRHRRRRRAAVGAAALSRDEQSHLDRRVGLAARRARAACPSRRRRARSPPRGARGGARAIARTTLPRSTAVRAAQLWLRRTRQPRRPRRRRGPERATRQSGSPSAGRVLSSHVPLAAGRSSPATRFGISAGITRPTSLRRRRGSRP